MAAMANPIVGWCTHSIKDPILWLEVNIEFQKFGSSILASL